MCNQHQHKVLVCISKFLKRSVTVINPIGNIINDDKQIKSIRGDCNSPFANATLTTYLTNHNIRYYFTPNVLTNRNSIVNLVIHTIHDMFYNLCPTVLLFDINLIQKIVHKYNNTVQKSLFNRLTPNQAHNNSMIEHVYIMEKNLELEKAK
jgi:hypothetical protein